MGINTLVGCVTSVTTDVRDVGGVSLADTVQVQVVAYWSILGIPLLPKSLDNVVAYNFSTEQTGDPAVFRAFLVDRNVTVVTYPDGGRERALMVVTEGQLKRSSYTSLPLQPVTTSGDHA